MAARRPTLTLVKLGRDMTNNWLSMSAADLGRGIGAGEIDPVDLTEAFLTAIEAHRFAGRIYARTTFDRARAEAAAAAMRAKAGVRLGPLDGVPVSWKDLFDTAGVATEAGCAMLEGRTPIRDAEVVARGARAGLVCLGKTHMSELAFSGLGVNPITATSPNIHDPNLAPGGSSSGAAASVAFGLAAAAVGSDTGGSVRIPSAWNDLVGLKTTAELIPNDGVVPLSPTLDTVGPLTRTVEDAALLYSILAGSPVPNLGATSLAGRSFFAPTGAVLDDLDPAVEQAFDTTIVRIEAAGANVTRGPAPELTEVLDHVAEGGAVVNTEGWAIWREMIEENGERMFPMTRARFASGGEVWAEKDAKARLAIPDLQANWLTRTAGFDAAILPTTPNQAPKTAELLADDSAYIRENLRALRNTRLGNLLRLSSLSQPSGTPGVGVMLFGGPLEESRLLRLGAAIEGALST